MGDLPCFCGVLNVGWVIINDMVSWKQQSVLSGFVNDHHFHICYATSGLHLYPLLYTVTNQWETDR